MTWCEANEVDFRLWLRAEPLLEALLEPSIMEVLPIISKRSFLGHRAILAACLREGNGLRQVLGMTGEVIVGQTVGDPIHLRSSDRPSGEETYSTNRLRTA